MSNARSPRSPGEQGPQGRGARTYSSSSSSSSQSSHTSATNSSFYDSRRTSRSVTNAMAGSARENPAYYSGMDMGEAVDHEVPTVPVDALLEMTEHARHLLVQRRFDAIKHNRRLREEGRDGSGYTLRQFTSNFKQLMRTLEQEDSRSEKDAKQLAIRKKKGLPPSRGLPTDSRSGGGASNEAPAEDTRFSGPLMSEIRRMEEEEATQKKQKMRAAIRQAQKHHLQQQQQVLNASDGGAGVGDDDGNDDVGNDGFTGGALAGVLDLIDEEELDKATSVPDDIKALSKAAASTARKQGELSAADERNDHIRLLGQMMEAHLALARPRFRRSKSSPGAYRSMATFEALAQQVREQEGHIALLQSQLEGAAPRAREKHLEKQITSLEDQIANQIALIRGLREKLRVLREQHRHCLSNQRPIKAAISNAYNAGLLAGVSGGSIPSAGRKENRGLVADRSSSSPSQPSLSMTAGVGRGVVLTPATFEGNAKEEPTKSAASARALIPPVNASGESSKGATTKKTSIGAVEEPSVADDTTDAAENKVPVSAPQRPQAQAGARPHTVAEESRIQTLDDAGNPLPQGKSAAVVVINVHSLSHLQQVMPEVLHAELRTLAEVLKPSSMSSHLYPQANSSQNAAGGRSNLRSHDGGGGGGGLGRSVRDLALSGFAGGRSAAPRAPASRHTAVHPPGTAGGLSQSVRSVGVSSELHPFLSCRGVESARFACDGTARYVFVFPSGSDAACYCLLTQQRLLDASWSPSLGDEYETGVELVQGSSTEYVWRGLRVSMGIEMGATIRPDPLLYDCSVPPPMTMSAAMLASNTGTRAQYPPPSRGSNSATGLDSPLSFALSPTPHAGHLVPPLPSIATPYAGGQSTSSYGGDDINASITTADEEEARSVAMAEALFTSNSPALSVPYEGHAVDTASYLCNIGVGGEVLLTKAVVDAIDVDAVTETLRGYFNYKYLIAMGSVECPFVDLSPLLRYWGDLSHHFSRSSVFRILCPTLVGREGVFRRDIVNAERSYATQQATAARGPFDEVPAPSVTMSGRPVTLVGLVLSDWRIASRSMSAGVACTAKGILFSAVREVSIGCRGYVSRVLNNCEAFVLVFEEPVNALSFGLKIHDHLMNTDWPDEVLRVPQFSRVEIEGNLLFSGPRVQCGLMMCTAGKRSSGATVVYTYRDALTNRVLYNGGGTELVSLFAQQAAGGELLVAADALPLVTKHHEYLGHAVHSHCCDLATATLDTLITLYQVFTRRRRLCASYINRELRLRSEDDAATDNKMVKLYEDQIAVLKEKLFHKDQAIKRLDMIIGEKNSVIAEIRSEVMKHAHYKYSHGDTIARISVGASRQTLESVLVGISFSNAEAIFRKFPTEAAASAKLYGQLIDKVAQECHGKLTARLPSGIARIYQFGEPMKAVEFWLKVFERALNIDWPARLEDSAEAGLIRAVDIIENLHPNLDQLIWRGLRPTAVMDFGLLHYQFDSVSKAFAPYGPEMDFIGQMLSFAGDGDCILSMACALQLTKAIASSRNTSVKIAPYGPEGMGCERLTSTDMRFRLKALRTMFPSELKLKTSQARTIHKALAVFVGIADVPSLTTEEQFTADIDTFQRCVERLLAEFKGELVGTDGRGHRYSVVFADIDDGIDFMSTIHSVLMHCTWSSALTREAEFADRIHENRQIMGGIAAKVGAHIVHNLTVMPQQFGGFRLYCHKELSFPCVLSYHAHAGETLATEEVFTELMQSTRERSAKIYPDLIGALTGIEEVRSHPIHVYQILPMELHFRSALFLEEDRINSDPLERLRLKNMSKKVTARRKHYFDAYIKDEQMLQTCERTLNPIDDPVRLSQRLYAHVKAATDSDRQRFETSQRTLQMLESVSMLTEDRASLPATTRGYPFHVHLVLYLMENVSMCRDYLFDKKYAVELLRADWGDDEDPDGEGKTINALLTHVGGSGTVGARSRKSRGSSRFAEGPRGKVNNEDDADGDEPVAEESFRSRMQAMRAQKVLPEDLVQLHVDVERFANILEMNGLSKEAAKQWVACFPDLCVGTNAGNNEAGESRRRSLTGAAANLANSKQLRLLASMRSTIGLQIDDVDSEMIRNSIVANLSHILHKLIYVSEDTAATN